ncbi:hypothetical protein ARMSODRAFT_948866 [Armillaria solidipes]|uniref:Uncharacterized protein n=1 Tax=Armillaria solidipes TaxID=1076256 RepID=A0A2H3CCN7_9AGAR|nr:hypothetical protein ARMSODRAFT_948866 [Armillaria solidipes]
MVVSGEQGSPQASYVPAWTATIINATSVNGASAKEITGNFENAARRGEKDDPPEDPTSSKTTSDTDPTTTQSADSTTETGGCKPKKKRTPQQKISSVFRAVAAAASSSSSSSSSSSPVRINGHGIVSHQVASSSSSTTLSSPLTSTSNLILVSLQEGTWADKRAEFMQYAWEEQPEIAEVYLGRRGEGPIGRRWSHVVLLAEGEGEVETIWLLGMVWEALPRPEVEAEEG